MSGRLLVAVDLTDHELVVDAAVESASGAEVSIVCGHGRCPYAVVWPHWRLGELGEAQRSHRDDVLALIGHALPAGYHPVAVTT